MPAKQPDSNFYSVVSAIAQFIEKAEKSSANNQTTQTPVTQSVAPEPGVLRSKT